MPARWGLQQTTRAPGSDKTGPGILWVRSQVDETLPHGLTYVKHLNITNLVLATHKKF